MMTKKIEGFSASMGPGDGDGDFDSADDRALWQLMGVLEDIEPSSDFMGSLRREFDCAPVVARPWYRRSWIPAAAAVLMVAIAIPFAMKGHDSDQPSTTSGDVAEYQGVMDILDGLSDADVLALEANEAESIQADWFGG